MGGIPFEQVHVGIHLGVSSPLDTLRHRRLSSGVLAVFFLKPSTLTHRVHGLDLDHQEPMNMFKETVGIAMRVESPAYPDTVWVIRSFAGVEWACPSGWRG